MTLDRYRYDWPREPLPQPPWAADGPFLTRPMPEGPDELSRDSRWPVFFPSPLCLATTTDGRTAGLEKVVGAAIVNRFPYTLALSFCRAALSPRHHPRDRFM